MGMITEAGKNIHLDSLIKGWTDEYSKLVADTVRKKLQAIAAEEIELLLADTIKALGGAVEIERDDDQRLIRVRLDLKLRPEDLRKVFTGECSLKELA